MISELKMFTETGRYTAKAYLPEYPRKNNQSIDREKMLEIILREEYGRINNQGVRVSYLTESVTEKDIAGKCRKLVFRVTLCRDDRNASFPVTVFIPYKAKKERTVVYLDFYAVGYNRYCPIEELLDMGLTVTHLNYQDVSSDDGNFSDGIAPLVSDRTQPDSAGKIAIWAYAARLTADFLLAEGIAEKGRLSVAGHSRLGKTALLAGALDERFSFVHSNCSGCCGAAVSREKTGETLADIWKRFPQWFCPDFGKHCGKEEEMMFDQHFLLAAVAPRKLSVVTAEEDLWADTDAQYLCAEAASIAYTELGITGLNEENGILQNNQSTTSGHIVFMKRTGTHYFSRSDWQFLNNCFN